jgi:hypothetical protein
MEVKKGKNPAYFPVFSLNQHHPYGSSAEPPYIPGPVTRPFNHDPLLERLQDLIRDGTGGFHQVLLFQARTGMTHGGGKLPVIGKDNQPRGPVIQAAYGVKPFPYIMGEQIPRQGPSLGITGTAYITGRLVEDQVPQGFFRFYPYPVKADLVSGAYLFPRKGYGTAVYRNPALGDKLFRRPAGGRPGMGQVYLKPDRRLIFL